MEHLVYVPFDGEIVPWWLFAVIVCINLFITMLTIVQSGNGKSGEINKDGGVRE